MNRKQRRTETKQTVAPAATAGGFVSPGALPPVQAMLADAVRHQLAGRSVDAERLYREILKADPRHAEALHMYGVLYLQVGRPDIAVDLIGKAVAQNGFAPIFHNHLGMAFQALGKLTEAVAAYEQALARRPDYAEAHYNLATALQGQDRREAAVAAYGLALALRPDHAEAHHNLGLALQAQGHRAAAALSYRQALVCRPDYAEAHCNLGAVLRLLGRLTAAVAACGRALIEQPNLAAAHYTLGLALQAQGKLAAAEVAYEQALALQPDNAELHYNLGNALQAQNKLTAAVVAYGRALAHAPDFAEAHCNLANTLRDLGDFGGAEASYHRALGLDPGNAMYLFDLSVIKRFTADDADLALMEGLAGDIGRLPPDDQCHLHFALGKAYDDIGAREKSFDHLLAGNALKRGLQAYDEAAMLAMFDRIRTTFTTESVGRASVPALPGKAGTEARPTEMNPIFVVGMPRSGTTLIEQILASHPQVFGAGELPLFEQTTAAVLGKGGFPEAVAGLAAADLHRLGDLYRSGLRDLAPGNVARITDKLPHNFLYCGLIHLALPDARIIHARRDPVDTCLSGFSKLFTVGHPYSYDLAELGRYYRHYAVLMDHWRDVLPEGVMLEVSYEDVVDDLEGQARRILAHCDLEWNDACLAFDKTQRPVRTASALQVRQPIYKSAVGRWRPDADLLKPLTDALAGSAGVRACE